MAGTDGGRDGVHRSDVASDQDQTEAADTCAGQSADMNHMSTPSDPRTNHHNENGRTQQQDWKKNYFSFDSSSPELCPIQSRFSPCSLSPVASLRLHESLDGLLFTLDSFILEEI